MTWRENLGRRRGLLLGTIGAIVLLAVAWHFCFFQGCPDVHKLGAHVAGGAPVLLDRNGKEFADLAPAEGELVKLSSLPKHVGEAFIAVEDQRFREHGAVDLQRVVGALWSNVRSGGVEEGSSTITMQLARNVFPDALPGRKRTVGRKILEIRVAHEIEGEFTKDQILEMYLNHIYFGNGATGIEAASRHYFAKPASKLTLAQAALLAALPKAPTHYDPRRHPKEALERRNLVLTLMQEQKRVPAAEAEAARKSPLGVASRPRAQRAAAPVAGWFVEEVRREVEERIGSDIYRERMKIHTTLDLTAQRAAEEELVRQLQAIESGALGAFHGPRYAAAMEAGDEQTDYLQGAVVAIEVGTGDVLAWVGGRDFRHSHFDRVKQARRQAGSAFKPFVYAAALQSGRALNQPLIDEPLRISMDNRRAWEPKNFDGAFDGRVTMRDALVRSKNVPTVRLAQEVGIPRVQKLAEEAGLEPPIPDQPSMALGTISVSPLELAGAFTTFASLGEHVAPRVVTKVEDAKGEVVWEAEEPDRERVLDEPVAYLVTDALREALVRGTGQSVSQAGFRAPAAGKTGTTNDGADAWFVGYTPDVVASVWVGFDKRRPIVAKATGGRVAAPVWARLMLRVYQKRPTPALWPRPSGIIEGMVDPGSGMLLASGCRPWAGTAYRELFVRGSAPVTVCPSQGEAMLMDPMQLPPLPDLEEGMETGVPLEEIDLGTTVDAMPMDPGPSPPVEGPAPVDAPPSEAPPLSYAPSSPRPPSPAPARPAVEPVLEPTPRPSPSAVPRESPSAVPRESPPPAEPAPEPSPSPG
jgi:penicillin-binding protein 1A